MSALEFSYGMRISFSQPVSHHRFTLRCLPGDTGRQRVQRLEVEVLPEGWLCRGTDAFGNCYLYGHREEAHNSFSVSVGGLAETVSPYQEPLLPEHQLGVFRMKTPLTAPGAALTALYRQLPRFEPQPALRLPRALLRMEQVSLCMRYQPGSTSHATTAEQAAARGQGVCQDYSHILLALLRMDGIPCRYVCGLMPGEGASHAWVDVAADGFWAALDPTNHCPVDGQYLMFAAGRDALDCQINRGVYRGFVEQNTEISARVICPDPPQEGATFP